MIIGAMKWKEKDGCRWAWWVWNAAEGTFQADFGVAQRPQGWCCIAWVPIVVVVQLLSHVWLFVTPWTAAHLILHRLPEPAQTHVHWVHDAIQPSHLTALVPSCPQSFPVSGSFPVSRLFTSGGQSIGASASASASWECFEYENENILIISQLGERIPEVLLNRCEHWGSRLTCSGIAQHPGETWEIVLLFPAVCPSFPCKRIVPPSPLLCDLLCYCVNMQKTGLATWLTLASGIWITITSMATE